MTTNNLNKTASRRLSYHQDSFKSRIRVETLACTTTQQWLSFSLRFTRILPIMSVKHSQKNIPDCKAWLDNQPIPTQHLRVLSQCHSLYLHQPNMSLHTSSVLECVIDTATTIIPDIKERSALFPQYPHQRKYNKTNKPPQKT
ncbi:hypothetical protein ACJBU6_05045 [Exserohilum turcicum]